jgi:hypothetical protein
MAYGALTIDEFPGEKIEIVCDACARRGVYGKARLAERYGAGMGLPDLLSKLTQDCREHTRPRHLRCSAVYPALRAQ